MIQIFSLPLEWWQAVLIFVVFIWGGFVRSGIGFGGAALTLPLLLMVVPDPLFFLPIIGVHLLIFGVITMYGEMRNIDWRYLGTLLLILLIPKIAGILGLLQLPSQIVVFIIYLVSLYYAIGYITGFVLKRKSKIGELLSLMLGGYTSGTALSGAPAIVPVVARHVSKQQLRSTLFALWAVLVVIKLGAFAATGLSFQLEHHLWLLPAATIGHVLGLKFHNWLHKASDVFFYRIVGAMLLVMAIIGLVMLDWDVVVTGLR